MRSRLKKSLSNGCMLSLVMMFVGVATIVIALFGSVVYNFVRPYVNNPIFLFAFGGIVILGAIGFILGALAGQHK